MAKKAVKAIKAPRGSDQFMIRLPEGMRDLLKLEAEKNGRSMNAEIIARLDYSFQEIINNEGLVAISKRLSAAADAFENVFIDMRDRKKKV